MVLLATINLIIATTFSGQLPCWYLGVNAAVSADAGTSRTRISICGNCRVAGFRFGAELWFLIIWQVFGRFRSLPPAPLHICCVFDLWVDLYHKILRPTGGKARFPLYFSNQTQAYSNSKVKQMQLNVGVYVESTSSSRKNKF